MTQTIPVFYACDEKFVPFTLVSVSSLAKNISQTDNYAVHILNTGISEEKQKLFSPLEKSNLSISFVDVSENIRQLESMLPLRDYYTKTTYYRFFISELFPQYDKVVYLDSDTVVLCDVAELWRSDLKDNYVAAVTDALVPEIPEFSAYVEEALGIYRYAYFNAGVMVLSCEKFRLHHIAQKFRALLAEYNFVVAQDQDYLNVLMKDRILHLNCEWNVEAPAEYPSETVPKIIHYNMAAKPWHNKDCNYAQYFWDFADKLPVAEFIRAQLAAYTDEQRREDVAVMQHLAELAQAEAENENNYWKRELKQCDESRVRILREISLLEQSGKFDVDVENDPPTLPLTGDVDYLRKHIYGKINRNIAFALAKAYVRKLVKNRQLIIKTDGVENLQNLKTSAVLTCNHIHPFDSFVMQYAFMQAKKHRRLFRVIREGNYTSFPGLYGYFMRHCDTLPLSSSLHTMKQFSRSVDKVLSEGHFVLIYPEQSMWWNYRKPRPMKKGAFKIAARNHVPIVPCFITMRDADIIGDDGFPVQEYTVHIGKPIMPTDANELCLENFAVWKDIYETSYGMPLCYDNIVKDA